MQSAPKHSPLKLASETSTRSLTAAVPMREEESIRSEFKNWLATFYFGVDLDECDADAKSANVVSILVNAGLSLQLLIKEFRYKSQKFILVISIDFLWSTTGKETPSAHFQPRRFLSLNICFNFVYCELELDLLN